VLRTAGQIKRNRLGDPEEILLMTCLRDMNLSKLVAQDVPLFLSLISDLFPALGMPLGQEHSELKAALRASVSAEKLIFHDSWCTKVVQLYETTIVRHGIMMVGPAGHIMKARAAWAFPAGIRSVAGGLHSLQATRGHQIIIG
jgi:dynein heavy chain